MVNQYTLLVALAILLASGGIVYYVNQPSGRSTKRLTIPPQVRFEVIDDEGETCHYNWDTTNGNFRFDCQDDEGFLDVTLFTQLASDGLEASFQIYHFEQADPRFTQDMGSPHNSQAPGESTEEVDAFFNEYANVEIKNVYDHGVSLVTGQAQHCTKEVTVGSHSIPSLTQENWQYEGECCCTVQGETLNSWSINYDGQTQFFHSDSEGKLRRIGASAKCSTDGNRVVAQTIKAWAPDAEIFRTPGSCNEPGDANFIDTNAMLEHAHLFQDHSTAAVMVGDLQKPFTIPQEEIVEILATADADPAEDPKDDPCAAFTGDKLKICQSKQKRRLLAFKSQQHIEGGPPPFGSDEFWELMEEYLSLKLPGTNWCGRGTHCQMSEANDFMGCHGCHNPPLTDNYGNPGGTPFCSHGTACPPSFNEDSDCCITDEFGWGRHHRENPRSATDVSCRQHDKCQYAWGKKASCKCDKAAYYGYNDYGINGPIGFNYNGGIPKLIFHPKNPFFSCRNWQKKCVERGWTGFCTKREYRWKSRVGVPIFFNKYNRGKTLKNGPLNYPLHRLDKDHGWCGGSPPTASPTPAPPTASPTPAPPTTPPPYTPNVITPSPPTPCFLYKKNADGDVMTLLVNKDTHELVTKTDMNTQAAVPCNGGGPAPYVRR